MYGSRTAQQRLSIHMTDIKQRNTWNKSLSDVIFREEAKFQDISTSEYLNTFPLVPDEQNLLWSQVDFQITCHMDKLKLEKKLQYLFTSWWSSGQVKSGVT